MSNIMEQTLFGEHIPTNSIHGDHIKTSKWTDEEKMAMMRNFIPKSQMNPTDEQIDKMAYSSGKRIVKAEKDIHKDENESSWDIIEANKSKKMLSNRLGNKFASAYVDEGVPLTESAPNPELAKQIMEKNQNYLLKGSLASIDTKISDQSRQEIRNDRRDRIASKDQWMDDNLDKINERIDKSRENLRKAQAAEINQALKSQTVDPSTVTAAFREYFNNKQTLLSQSYVDIKKHEKTREDAIKRQTNIKTSLDQPSLPTKVSNSSLYNQLIEKLPENFKQKLIKDAIE